MADPRNFFWLFFSLKGRAGRAAYFLAGLFVLIVQMFFFYRVGMEVEGSPASQAWAGAFLVAVLVATWCNFALTAKRFHDFGKPTGYAAISLVAGFILVVVLSLIKGEDGPNRYGPGPDIAI
ncbi:MAG: DUF805 domain-containing protein [Rhizobiales bacterium]|nr:DUF805 domain-containing protein [Hyphomicrobiales bacterium]